MPLDPDPADDLGINLSDWPRIVEALRHDDSYSRHGRILKARRWALIRVFAPPHTSRAPDAAYHLDPTFHLQIHIAEGLLDELDTL